MTTHLCGGFTEERPLDEEAVGILESCRAEIEEARLLAVEKKVSFGAIAVGVAAEKLLTLRNASSGPAVFSFETPPAGWQIKPMRGMVRGGWRMQARGGWRTVRRLA